LEGGPRINVAEVGFFPIGICTDIRPSVTSFFSENYGANAPGGRGFLGRDHLATVGKIIQNDLLGGAFDVSAFGLKEIEETAAAEAAKAAEAAESGIET
jgi:hypothetical protein